MRVIKVRMCKNQGRFKDSLVKVQHFQNAELMMDAQTGFMQASMSEIQGLFKDF